MSKNIQIATGVLAVALIISVYQNISQMNQIKSLKNTNVVAEAQMKKIVGEVGKLMSLPTDEIPTIATVSDADKLKDQPFFANAKVGDNVVIYTAAKKAILYRPGENKIIEVAPLNIDNSAAAVSALPTETPTPTPTTTPKK